MKNFLVNVKNALSYFKPSSPHWRTAAAQSKEVRVLLVLLGVMVGLFALEVLGGLFWLVMNGNMLAIGLVVALVGWLLVTVFSQLAARVLKGKHKVVSLSLAALATLFGVLVLRQEAMMIYAEPAERAAHITHLSPELLVAMQQLVQKEPAIEGLIVELNAYFVRQTLRHTMESEAYLSGYKGMDQEKMRRWLREEEEEERTAMIQRFGKLLP